MLQAGQPPKRKNTTTAGPPARNAAEAAAGNRNVRHNIEDVSTSTRTTSDMASKMGEVAASLETDGQGLGHQVEQFLGDMRAA